ncbi:DNA-binding response regulator [Lysobacter sp. TY2-98]|uniref:response regulator transcription factor n=1 Tax=Lysobacter sp. TY2-98 TaxID=2290922 RepID=UPI000E200ACF|nr:response regulator transcription factor [Lysobacter sp. TY2-98]AXK72177.1 DNA-binding response regulator [Lysobacter sp. TY2-98]
MSQRILIIDDDERLCAMLEQYLAQGGYSVTSRHTAADGLAEQRRTPADAIILDLMLPDASGLDVCTRLRQRSGVPVVMLTARGDPMDRVVGLELGADDYLPKPFEPRELLARLRTVLRRGQHAINPVMRFGRLEIDREARRARIDGQPRPLTGHQFDILITLAERAGRVVSRTQLLDAIGGRVLDTFDRTVDVHISSIRAAIEDDPRQPRRILTLRGVGYLFTRVQDEDTPA